MLYKNKRKTVAFLPAGNPHWSAKLCAKQVCNDFYFVKTPNFKNKTINLILSYFKSFYYCFKVPKHDIYLVNGSAGLFLGVLKKRLRRENCKLILRVNDSMFSNYELNYFKQWFLRKLYSNLDGAIAISEMIKKDINLKVPNLPVEIFHTRLIDKSLYKNAPDFDSRNILCLGTAPHLRKGTDIQIKVHKRFSSKKMFILGNLDYIKKIHNQPTNKNIIFTGIANPKKYFSKTLFLLHPARFDAGGTSVLEAMAAGLIPIVSHMTGNKDIVRKVDPSLIINDFLVKSYAEKLSELMNKSDEELKELSNKCITISKEYYGLKSIAKFKNKFWRVVNT
ncbi:MAG: glycosyltransferase family 4 protein [Promethearchaeota archaeon]